MSGGGRTAVVTGAGSRRGIGRATAHALAAAGWSVAVVDLRGADDAAREVADAQRLSLTGEITNVDWKDIQRRVFAERIDPISVGGEEYRRGPETPNITLYSGTASFSGPRELTVSFSDANSSPRSAV